jgi:hypothetical protein
MASTRGQFIVEAATRNGPMKQKDFHLLIFRMMTFSESDGRIRLRRISGKAVVRWKTKRKNEWEKRHGISRTTAEESGETADAEERDEE